MRTIFLPHKTPTRKNTYRRADRERSMVFQLFIVILHLILFRVCLACLCKHCSQANLKMPTANLKCDVVCGLDGVQKNCVEVQILYLYRHFDCHGWRSRCRCPTWLVSLFVPTKQPNTLISRALDQPNSEQSTLGKSRVAHCNDCRTGTSCLAEGADVVWWSANRRRCIQVYSRRNMFFNNCKA